MSNHIQIILPTIYEDLPFAVAETNAMRVPLMEELDQAIEKRLCRIALFTVTFTVFITALGICINIYRPMLLTVFLYGTCIALVVLLIGLVCVLNVFSVDKRFSGDQELENGDGHLIIVLEN